VNLGDLVFLLVFLLSLGAVIGAAIAAARGRRARAGTIIRRLAVALGVYFTIVIVVALTSTQRFVPLGYEQCSDDWCIAADSVHRDTTSGAVTYTVGFRLSSRARRIAQRERFVVAYVQTGDGRRIDASPDNAAVPFDTLLEAEQTIRASRRFVIPLPARSVGLVVAREGGFRFPRCCIIGDEDSMFHKRVVVRLD
jgi:hypothetical protein